MSLAIDSSTPAPTEITANIASKATGAFNPAASSVIVLFVAWECISATLVPSVSGVSGGGLSWGPISGAAVSGKAYPTNNYSDVEAWYAPCPSGASGLVATVTFSENTHNTSGAVGIIQPVVFTDAASTQNGTVGTVVSGAPSKAITPSATGSLVFACCSSDDGNTAPSAFGTNQTDTINGTASIELGTGLNSVWWCQYDTVTTTSGTPVTMSATNTDNNYTNFLCVEILAFVPADLNVDLIN